MGKSVRRVPRERMSQSRLDSLIQPNNSVDTCDTQTHQVLAGTIDYDTMLPEETIKEFCVNVHNMLSRYQYNKDQYIYLENEMQDILHYIEMTADKNANVGYKLYKRLSEIRRERRSCKSEIELLQPVYDAFNDMEMLNTLTRIQGLCASTKRIINNRCYTVRTDILDQFTKASNDG